MLTEKRLRKHIRKQLLKLALESHQVRLKEAPDAGEEPGASEETPAGSETGGGSVATIKKGLAIAFPDWADDIKNVDLKSSFVDEFAGLIKNAMTAAEEGGLVKAEKTSDRMTSNL